MMELKLILKAQPVSCSFAFSDQYCLDAEGALSNFSKGCDKITLLPPSFT